MTTRAKRNTDTPAAITAAVDFLQSPAANSFLLSQKLLMETTRFWARRMRAYADQAEAFARCANPQDFAAAQKLFIERMQDDYTRETGVVANLLGAANEAANAPRAARNGDAGRPAN